MQGRWCWILSSPPGSVPVFASLDCLVAEQGCVQEHSCLGLYRVLEYCTAEEAVSPLSSDARTECLEAQNALQNYRPLQVCKCQRGSRREEHCLRVYWTVRFAGRFVCVHELQHSEHPLWLNTFFISIWWVWSVPVRRTETEFGAEHWDVSYGLHHGRYRRWPLHLNKSVTLVPLAGAHMSFPLDDLQLPLFLWMAKTSVWRQLRTVACMRNAAPCGPNMW